MNKFQNNRLKEFLEIDKNVKSGQPKAPEEQKVADNSKDMKSVFGKLKEEIDEDE